MAEKVELLAAYCLYRGYTAVCSVLFKVEALGRLARLKVRGVRRWLNSLLV